MTELIERLMQIAAANPKGFTVTIPDCIPVRTGWAIGHRDTQYSFGKKGLQKVVKHSLQTTRIVGGRKGYDGRYYFDTIIIEDDPYKAIDLKQEHRQQAIYNLQTGKIL